MINVARLSGLVFGAFVGFTPLAHAALTPELQKTLRAATFEVVMKKPEKDPVTYEKPLPLDLMPYIERNDVYRSMGTAFALGSNTYVTAAHVIEAGIGSQYGPPALRRSDGRVFEIDKIMKFSAYEDFVVFSLRQDPASSALSVSRDPKLDDPVLAVGNALGEGIVIRDGLFTSETPEERDGRWKWIRFSAAASPGNSGGPLCDVRGNVIGIVIGKSPNENLNYALPIARVLDAPVSKARFDDRILVALPFLHGTMTYAYQDEFDLPLAWTGFADAYRKVTERHADESRSQLLKKYTDTLFPVGPGSDDLLFDAAVDIRPRLILQGDDGRWFASDSDYDEVQLSGDGTVSVANVAGVKLLHLVRPNRAADDAFYGDSKAFMELALKALNVQRQVGEDDIRVTSLGRAIEDGMFVDRYGRRWQQRVWAIPYRDSYLVGMLLPTPEGYSAIIKLTPSASLHSTVETTRLLAEFLDVSYEGTLAQWRATLQRRSLLAASLDEVKLEQSPNWTLRTSKFVSSVPPMVLSLSETSRIRLTMGFMKLGARTVWDIQKVWWEKDERAESALILWRFARPPETAKLQIRNRFADIQARHTPYDGTPSRDSETSFSATTVLEIPGKTPGTVSPDLVYGLTIRATGLDGVMNATVSFDNVLAATQILEHGTGVEVARPQSASLDAVTEFEHMVMAAAVATNPILGRDIRGRVVSDDLRDLMDRFRRDAESERTDDTPARRQQLIDEAKQRLAWLGSYWNEYPGLSHNREMWGDFLAKNHLPPDTPHRPAVTAAEMQLKEALDGPLSSEWRQRARLLREAYIEERNYIVRQSTPASLAPLFVNRKADCPLPAPSTSGTNLPKVGQSLRTLEELWPPQSKRLGEEGTVIATMRISSTGCVTGIAIVGSSGSDFMDSAVRSFLEATIFLPGDVGGKAIESVVSIPVVFKLSDNDSKPPSPRSASK
jgi:serine protease Do